jgi:hypothetical protein
LTELRLFGHVLGVEGPGGVGGDGFGGGLSDLDVTELDGLFLQHAVEVSHEFQHHAGANVAVQAFGIELLHEGLFDGGLAGVDLRRSQRVRVKSQKKKENSITNISGNFPLRKRKDLSLLVVVNIFFIYLVSTKEYQI